MHTLDYLNQKVNEAIENLPYSAEPKNLYDPIRYIMGMAGKRIRPVLTLAACNLFSDDIERALSPAIAVEVFHNFTLVHDDIMDNANLRRGKATIHKKWNENIAILSGDAMTVLAYKLLVNVHPDYMARVINIFNNFALGICEGQQMDMDFESKPMVNRVEYLTMIEKKTSILLKGALEIGAVIGGAIEDDIVKLGEFGRCMGIAFQLQDDLLDCFSDESIFGKKRGGDIIASKKTMLAIITFEKLSSVDKKQFIELYNNRNIDETYKVEKILNYYTRVNVQKDIKDIIDEYFDRAILSLESVEVDKSKKVVMSQILNRILTRNN